MAAKMGLGKGLDLLIPSEPKKPNSGKKSEDDLKAKNEESNGLADEKQNQEIVTEQNVSDSKKISSSEIVVDIKKLEPNHDQPRKQFDEDSLIELSESIKQFGIIQPLLVQQKEDYYEIIAGERRWRAARLAGLKEVPVIIKNYTPQEILEISLIENLQREDLNPIEEAMSFRKLIEEFHLKQEEVAERLAKSRTAITNSMRLLKLDQRVQQMLVDDMITSGHARAILGIEDGEEQFRISMKIFDEKLSVRDVEKLVKEYLNPVKQKQEKMKNDFLYKELEERIKNILGTKVIIKNQSNNKGKIELQYYSQDELERIIQLIQSIQG